MLINKKLVRKVGWYLIFAGAVCFIIMLVIANDTKFAPEKQPWVVPYLLIVSIIAGIIGIILITKTVTR